MLEKVGPFRAGDRPRASWLQQMLEGLRKALNIKAGPGIRLTDTGAGIVISSTKTSSSGAGSQVLFALGASRSGDQLVVGSSPLSTGTNPFFTTIGGLAGSLTIGDVLYVKMAGFIAGHTLNTYTFNSLSLYENNTSGAYCGSPGFSPGLNVNNNFKLIYWTIDLTLNIFAISGSMNSMNWFSVFCAGFPSDTPSWNVASLSAFTSIAVPHLSKHSISPAALAALTDIVIRPNFQANTTNGGTVTLLHLTVVKSSTPQ
jgi:hypothetical protein